MIRVVDDADGASRVQASLARLTGAEIAANIMANVVDRAANREFEQATADIKAELATAKDMAATAEEKVAKARAKATKLEDEASKVHERQADALIVLVEQRMDSVPAGVRERIASASTATLSGWLSDIALRNNLEALLAKDQSGAEEEAARA